MVRTPAIILVGGAGGSGKTTLSKHLAYELQLPSVTCDDVRDGLIMTFGERQNVDRLHEAFYGALQAMLDHGVSAIADKAWVRDVSEDDVRRRLLVRAVPVYVHCVASNPTDRLERRVRDRHPGLGEDFYKTCRETALAKLDSTSVPMDLDLRPLTVRTDDGYEPVLEEIVALVRTALHLGRGCGRRARTPHERQTVLDEG